MIQTWRAFCIPDAYCATSSRAADGAARTPRMGGTSYTSHNLKQMRRTLLILTLSLPLLSACASGGGMRPRYDAAEGESKVEQVILQTPQGVRMTARYSWE